MNAPQNRRKFLRTAGTLLALPALESAGFRKFVRAAEPGLPPKRVVFLGIGYGVTQETWFPSLQEPGVSYTLPDGLKPLERHRHSFSIVQGVCNKLSAEAHWGSTYWLTGANRYGDGSGGMHNSISADQVAAGVLGRDTRFASLQLNGSDPDISGPGHGTGLSLAWDVRGKPMAGVNSPVALFHKLFSADSLPLEQRQAALREKRSILDAVGEEVSDVKRGLNRRDHEKLDEYFQGIREIELRMGREEKWLDVPKPAAPLREPGAGLLGVEEVKLMYDLLVAAFQTDSTRVATYRQPISNLLKSLSIKVAPHDMSHYSIGERMDASQKRDRVQSELLAGFLDRLEAEKDSEGRSLLDNTVVVFGSNLRTVHTLENCPTLVVGRGAGLKLGHNLVVSRNTPLCNVWLTLLRGLGLDLERHGDSSGVLKELIA
jgi:hypothetical protein